MTQFLIIGFVGLALVVVSVVFGDILDFDLDFGDFGGDLFSTATIGGFTGALGFGGALTLNATSLAWLAWVVGIAAGILSALGVAWLTRALKRSESASSVPSRELVGQSGTVISPIPADGYGVVRITSGGHLLTLNAKASQPIEQGARVWVSDVLSASGVEVTLIDEAPSV